MRQFFPDFFSVPRGEPSDDEMDKDEGTLFSVFTSLFENTLTFQYELIEYLVSFIYCVLGEIQRCKGQSSFSVSHSQGQGAQS